jgi:hypothetical protein
LTNESDRSFDRKYDERRRIIINILEQQCTIDQPVKPLEQNEKRNEKCVTLSSTLPHLHHMSRLGSQFPGGFLLLTMGV